MQVDGQMVPVEGIYEDQSDQYVDPQAEKFAETLAEVREEMGVSVAASGTDTGSSPESMSNGASDSSPVSHKIKEIVSSMSEMTNQHYQQETRTDGLEVKRVGDAHHSEHDAHLTQLKEISNEYLAHRLDTIRHQALFSTVAASGSQASKGINQLLRGS